MYGVPGLVVVQEIPHIPKVTGNKTFYEIFKIVNTLLLRGVCFGGLLFGRTVGGGALSLYAP